MQLGELISELERLMAIASHPIAQLYVEGSPISLAVDGIGSYRGYYEDLAINVCSARDSKYPTTEYVLELLKKSLGDHMTGYKGGVYKITPQTRVWISNYGECSGALVTGVRMRKAFDGDTSTLLTWNRDED